VGGDGTHRGAALLAETAERRGVQVSIACVPKTVDCDLPIIDRSFGFQTAVELGVRPITSAHTEAHSATRGVGLVKVMGRSAGFIALYASLASRDVNVCLLPEADWRLDKLCAFLEERLERSNHAVIVVAEGAESVEVREERERLAAAGMEPRVERDPSGNPVLPDVGEYLKAGITSHFKRKGQVCNLKYIDPSYVLRAAPANAADSDLCAQLAFNCLHGAMGGYTAFTVGTVENVAVWLPVQLMATGKPRRVDIYSRIYARLISSTGQPDLS
jgi:6-phosphofructokinase 1